MKIVFKVFSIALLMAFATMSARAVDENAIGSSSGDVFAKVGGAGAQFLKIPLGARGTAMGGAQGAVANDLTAIFWNPAGIANIHSISANFSYTQWFAGFSHNFAALALPFGDNFTAAFNLVSFGSGDIPITTLDRPDGTGANYSVSDIAFGFAFGGYLTEQFSFGINAKYINSSFASVSSSGIAFDIGTRYETGIQGIAVGFSLHNLGTEQQYTGQDLRTTRKILEAMNASPVDAEYVSSGFSLPLAFRAGISSNVYETEEHMVVAAFDFVTYSDTPEEFMIGAEYTWRDFVSVRGGYNIGQDQFGLTGGVGLKYDGGGFGGVIDYSIAPTFDLGLVNRLSLSLSFGS
ncbi:MAG: PorV/PorQ family protein [Candidatus Kapaibacterium sp.]